tara:strand:+ start:790 stop:1086 length:297 start_codon:yes stop_codon:yes gene_type:complete
MLTDFIAAGYSEDLFWSLTPRQVDTHFAAYRKRHRVERNMLMETSFYAAIVPHMKKTPKLRDFLIPDDEAPKRRQSWQEMKAALMLAIPPKKETQDGR